MTQVVFKKVWHPKNAIKAYELARSGFSDRRIAEAFGVSHITLREWKERHRLFRYAIDRARKQRNGQSGVEQFHEYVYKQLPDNLKALWDELKACWGDGGGGLEGAEALFKKNGGVRCRQHLFLYALPYTNFNITEACRRVGIS